MMLTTGKVPAVRRVENHLLYLAYTPKYPKKFAAVSHCKLSTRHKHRQTQFLKAGATADPQKTFQSGGHLELLAFPAETNYASKSYSNAMICKLAYSSNSELAYGTYKEQYRSSSMCSSPIRYILQRHNFYGEGWQTARSGFTTCA